MNIFQKIKQWYKDLGHKHETCTRCKKEIYGYRQKLYSIPGLTYTKIFVIDPVITGEYTMQPIRKEFHYHETCFAETHETPLSFTTTRNLK